MKTYRLWRDGGEIECVVDARDDDHALAVLSERLKKTLAFDGVGQQFLLERIDNKNATFRRPVGRAVYEISPPSK